MNIAWKGPLPIWIASPPPEFNDIPSPKLKLIVNEAVASVITIESAKVTIPSSLSTSPSFSAKCPFVSTKIPLISADVPLMFVAVAILVQESPEPPKCVKVSVNFPAVTALDEQTELFVCDPLPLVWLPDPAIVPQKTPYPLERPSIEPSIWKDAVIPNELFIIAYPWV